jgi:hypothetical protein
MRSAYFGFSTGRDTDAAKATFAIVDKGSLVLKAAMVSAPYA